MSKSEGLGALPIGALKGVGARMAERLERLSIRSVQDLLFHLPLRYQDRTRVTPMGALRPGDEIVTAGAITLTEVRLGRRRSLLSRVEDGTGSLLLRFFHFSPSQQAALSTGRRIACFGEVRRGPYELEMVHPEYHFLGEQDPVAVEETLTPVYPTTEGLRQTGLRRLTEEALRVLDEDPGGDDLLPPAIVESLALPSLREALHTVHRPPPDVSTGALLEGVHPAQRRLAFEELLAHHLSLRTLRHRVRRRRAPRLSARGALTARFLEVLPFSLTRDQGAVSEVIAAELDRPHPMQRLLQGDVGSGKTVVAALAALRAIEAGYQVALMAPTEVLAEQHESTFRRWLEPLSLTSDWLSGRLTAKARREVLERVTRGETQLVVGTHALFQEDVHYARLGLVVVDEQHRFGVHQRLALHEKGRDAELYPHQLIMTATPIPRTLAMTSYADLDTSTIRSLPPGRQPVETVAVPDTRRDEVVTRIRRACAGGRQAYWVCTLIDESEALQAQAANETAAQLQAALPELSVGLVHGRMKGHEKEAVMAGFKAGEVQLLVATTVIEVGVDVPRASLMIIENAERLGLAQLHQLRGRVGRGRERSTCLLLYHGPLSRLARTRLGTLRETHDGFVIARRDLELRGPGELLGTRQTGLPQFRVADLSRDRGFFDDIERVAEGLLRDHPDRVAALLRRWIGNGVQYGHV